MNQELKNIREASDEVAESLWSVGRRMLATTIIERAILAAAGTIALEGHDGGDLVNKVDEAIRDVCEEFTR